MKDKSIINNGKMEIIIGSGSAILILGENFKSDKFYDKIEVLFDHLIMNDNINKVHIFLSEDMWRDCVWCGFNSQLTMLMTFFEYIRNSDIKYIIHFRNSKIRFNFPKRIIPNNIKVVNDLDHPIYFRIGNNKYLKVVLGNSITYEISYVDKMYN